MKSGRSQNGTNIEICFMFKWARQNEIVPGRFRFGRNSFFSRYLHETRTKIAQTDLKSSRLLDRVEYVQSGMKFVRIVHIHLKKIALEIAAKTANALFFIQGNNSLGSTVIFLFETANLAIQLYIKYPFMLNSSILIMTGVSIMISQSHFSPNHFSTPKHYHTAKIEKRRGKEGIWKDISCSQILWCRKWLKLWRVKVSCGRKLKCP